MGVLYANVDGVWEEVGGGAIGPAGETGPTGPTGPTGATGPTPAVFTSSTQGSVPASGGGTAFFIRADGDWCTHIVAKSTTPTAADYGLASIPIGAIWVQMP